MGSMIAPLIMPSVEADRGSGVLGLQVPYISQPLSIMTYAAPAYIRVITSKCTSKRLRLQLFG